MTKHDHYKAAHAREWALSQLRDFQKLSRDGIRSWQFGHLDQSLKHAVRNSPFYQDLALRERLPDCIRDNGDLTRIPFTTKEHLRRHYPFGFLAAPRTELVRYGESTGTSGSPTSSFITYEDWILGNVSVEHSLAQVFSPGDIVFIAVPLELTFASYDIDRALEALGVTVVAVGALNQVCPFDRVVEMMQTLKPAGIVCTPTRALRLWDLARRRGLDPLASELRILFYVGETCAQSKLQHIARMWQVGLVNAYGSTETNSIALPCRCRRLHLAEDRYYPEVVDPSSGTPTEDGGRGELVLTSLRARAMPLLRYRTGDLVSINDAECPCGSRRRVLVHHGRVDERFVVGDTVIQRIDLEELILSDDGSDAYYVADVQDDVLFVWVVLKDGAPEVLLEKITARIRESYGIRTVVSSIEREIIMRAMDKRLKPGSLALEDLEVEAVQ